MRLLLASSIAFLAGGVAAYSAVEGLSFVDDDLSAALGLSEPASPVVSTVQVAQAEPTDTGAAAGMPDDASPEADNEPISEAPASEGEAATSQPDRPATLNSFAPTDQPAVAMPPIGLPDPDEAQAALPDGQKITLKASPENAPEIGTVRWVPESLYCGFVETDMPGPTEVASAAEAGDVTTTDQASSDEPSAEDVENKAAAVEKQAPEDLLFVTERHYDGRAAMERGYMRLGGLMRELTLKSVQEQDGGELRHYATFGGAPIDIRLDMRRIMTDADKKLKAWHKPDRLLYHGVMTVGRGDAVRELGFTGSCG
ncbi:hypothetical protein [Notoacmeibacter sp. MSK16QG-6]|uniref:hypothetical protein n=1 Tax=Notoacmeibacter sp. MSK16QG-6 TaxID=2957982 RepID=UPI00209D11BC|nr:hypothetical protein [Notoacmeibacter sp. MSK16QG-6]MCP1200967.1 hypothetical protein [Notoacmeibacter sp. MSK16QG-6]